MQKFLIYLCVFLPSFLKVQIYRKIFGWHVGHGCKIGMSLIKADRVVIGNNVRIGHFNALINMKHLEMGDHVWIKIFNYIGGGERCILGPEVEIARFNEINAIHNALCSNPFTSELIVGKGAVITAQHKIDYTDSVIIGERVVIGGRQTCIWTHNRQSTAPVSIGAQCYVGSGCQFVAGSVVPDRCVLALGTIVSKPLSKPDSVYGGVPAKWLKDIDEGNRAYVEFDTRPDLRS